LLISIFSLALSSCAGDVSSEAPPIKVQATSPTNVQATAGNKQNTLSWTAVTGADSYNIYQSPRTIGDISNTALL
jgi:outer membrane protease